MFRPVFEVLEKREVFAAGPLAAIPMVITGAGPGAGPHIHEVRSAVVTPVTRSVAASPAGAYTYIVGPNVTDVVYVGGSDRVLTAGTMGRGLADFNNDGRVDGSDFVSSGQSRHRVSSRQVVHDGPQIVRLAMARWWRV